MNDSLKKIKLLIKLPLAPVLLVLLTVCTNIMFAQDTLIKPLPINLSENLEFNKKKEGFLKKVLQTIKFKENRDLKEQERIYQFIRKLIDEKDLNIDLNINEISRVLDSIQKADSLKFDSINTELAKNKDAIDSLKNKVEEKSKPVKDSITAKKEKDSIVLQQQQKNDSLLKKIRSVNYTCKSLDKKRDTTFQYCLKPLTKIIGWHNSWNKEEYKNYNFNYLSAINLYGYELDVDGTAKNPDEIVEFKKPGGVIEFADNRGSEVYITVFNKYPYQIKNFLSNSKAQRVLINNIFSLITENQISGINIYFEGLLSEDAQRFDLFIKELSLKFKEYANFHKKQIDLTLTLPAIYDSKSLEDANTYNLTVLNQFIDYYLVSTDKMWRTENNWAQPSSPLKSEGNSDFGTINSTVNFYSNGKIPLDKLIVSVSYLGIEWPLIGPEGKVDKNYNPSDIEYSEIIGSYKNNKDFTNNMEQGFDSISASAFLNITKEVADFYEPKFKQIWYEDNRSLEIKYKWILANKLGGVSIRGLGYDDGYSELWDVLGSTLIKIDSSRSFPRAVSLKLCQIDSIKKMDSINERSLDTKIFRNKNYWENFQWFNYTSAIEESKDSTSLLNKFYERLKKYRLYSDYKWAVNPETYFITDYGKKLNLKEDGENLNNEQTCRCLYERMIIFSKISFYLGFICILFIAALIFRINYLDRYNKVRNIERIVIKIVSLLFGIVGMLLIFYGLYMTPYFKEFGASNQGNVSMGLLVILIILGILLGLFISYRLTKGKYLAKNLP